MAPVKSEGCDGQQAPPGWGSVLAIPIGVAVRVDLVTAHMHSKVNAVAPFGPQQVVFFGEFVFEKPERVGDIGAERRQTGRGDGDVLPSANGFRMLFGALRARLRFRAGARNEKLNGSAGRAKRVALLDGGELVVIVIVDRPQGHGRWGRDLRDIGHVAEEHRILVRNSVIRCGRSDNLRG